MVPNAVTLRVDVRVSSGGCGSDPLQTQQKAAQPQEAAQQFSCMGMKLFISKSRDRMHRNPRRPVPRAQGQSPDGKLVCSVTRLSCTFPGCSFCPAASRREGGAQRCSAVLGGTRQEKLCWPCVHEPRVVPASLCTLQDAVVVRTAADLIWETATLSAVWASSAGKTGRTGMFLSSKRDIGNIPGKT